VKRLLWPGAVKVLAAPPPGPVTACRSMLWGSLLLGLFSSQNSTVSPSRTRMKRPGTVPPYVQNVYSTPSASGITFSMTSSVTFTFAAVVRVMGGGTIGGSVSTAFSSGSAGPAVSSSRHSEATMCSTSRNE